MRTVKSINKEAEEALEKYKKHWNDCYICQYQATCEEDEIVCYEAQWLYEDYERVRDEADYAEQVFEHELRERNIDELTINKLTIKEAAKGDTYAKVAVRKHLRKWAETHGTDHAKIEARHIVIHSIAFLDKGSVDKYSDELINFINDLR